MFAAQAARQVVLIERGRAFDIARSLPEQFEPAIEMARLDRQSCRPRFVSRGRSSMVRLQCLDRSLLSRAARRR